ncbi:MAG: hypothetical protein JW943_16025 [Deltaproteobacteria bacterium]|nr:hypothetical protein [Deltaproteobacteria bacterium]
MNWSMTSVSYRMSGSGSWQNLLSDEFARRLYADIYPYGAPFPAAQDQAGKLFWLWKQAGIVEIADQKVIPRGPVMADDDLTILNPWFRDMSDAMCRAVTERLDDYLHLAKRLCGGTSPDKQAIDNILTILICAVTLDSWVFSRLRQEVIGAYPPRGDAGVFFFWGYAFSAGPQRIFGFTTYGGRMGWQLHMIRSHGMDREAVKTVLNRRDIWDVLNYFVSKRGLREDASMLDRRAAGLSLKAIHTLQNIGLLDSGDPPRPAVPVLTDRDRGAINQLCGEVSLKIHRHFLASIDGLESLRRRCSFADCLRPDCLCMIFHLAYAYAADTLVEKGIIPDFPQKAGGEWGVWIH